MLSSLETPVNTTRKFQIFPVFDGAECAKIIKTVQKNITPVAAALAEHGVKTEVRHSAVYHIPKTKEYHWIYAKINPQIKEANKLWNFEVAGFEDLQMLEYGISNYFDWHMDGFSPNTATRKMGFSVALSKPDDYKKGDMEFQWGAEPYLLPKEKLPQGSMIVFPSFLLHRVRGIASGKRYHLVSWVRGTQGWR